jgi:hypothetical protein
VAVATRSLVEKLRQSVPLSAVERHGFLRLPEFLLHLRDGVAGFPLLQLPSFSESRAGSRVALSLLIGHLRGLGCVHWNLDMASSRIQRHKLDMVRSLTRGGNRNGE